MYELRKIYNYSIKNRINDINFINKFICSEEK